MSLSAKFRVSGKVQGVFFRLSAKQQADNLGLAGWVRNCADGDVEGVVSGTAEQVDAFSKWLAVGPARARVKELAFDKCQYQFFTDFEVR